MSDCVVCGTDVATISDTPICSISCKEDWVEQEIKSGSHTCPICSYVADDTLGLLRHINKSEGMHVKYNYNIAEFVEYSRKCELCNDPFIPTKGNVNKFCSKECEGLARRSDAYSMRRSGKYQDWKESMLAQHNSCVQCGREDNLHVHHIVPVSEDPSRIIDDSNGTVLCASCHAEEHKDDRVYGLLKQQAGL